MSASRSHNLFGLRPAVLDDIPGSPNSRRTCVHPLQTDESRVWRAPALSAKIVSLLQARLRQPRRRFLVGPLASVLKSDWQVLTVHQYVRLANAVNRQLADVATGSKLTAASCEHVLNLVDDFQSRGPYAALRTNDRHLRGFKLSLTDVYDYWQSAGSPNRHLVAARLFASQLAFSPYYSSFLQFSGGVLTTPAFRLLSFCQDFGIDLHDLAFEISTFQSAHHRLPSLHAFTVRCLRSLQASHPAYFTRYHVPVVRQARFTVRSTVRNLD